MVSLVLDQGEFEAPGLSHGSTVTHSYRTALHRKPGAFLGFLREVRTAATRVPQEFSFRRFEGIGEHDLYLEFEGTCFFLGHWT